MKTLKSIIGIMILSLTLTMVSCNESKKSEGVTEEQAEMKEYASAYVCPMHCEGSGSDSEGECPVCGMEYVKNEDHVKDGHSH